MWVKVSKAPPVEQHLQHHQVRGAKHGHRRWQHKDGSLIYPEGYEHYGVTKPEDQAAEKLKSANKKALNKNLNDVESSTKSILSERDKAVREFNQTLNKQAQQDSADYKAGKITIEELRKRNDARNEERIKGSDEIRGKYDEDYRKESAKNKKLPEDFEDSDMGESARKYRESHKDSGGEPPKGSDSDGASKGNEANALVPYKKGPVSEKTQYKKVENEKVSGEVEDGPTKYTKSNNDSNTKYNKRKDDDVIEGTYKEVKSETSKKEKTSKEDNSSEKKSSKKEQKKAAKEEVKREEQIKKDTETMKDAVKDKNQNDSSSEPPKEHLPTSSADYRSIGKALKYTSDNIGLMKGLVDTVEGARQRNRVREAVGERKLSKPISEMSDKEINDTLNRWANEDRIANATVGQKSRASEKIGTALDVVGNLTYQTSNAFYIAENIRSIAERH